MTLTTNDRKLRGESRWGTAALGIVTWAERGKLQIASPPLPAEGTTTVG